MQKVVRILSFSMMGAIILLLIAASISEKFVGADFAYKYFYTAPWTIGLWCSTVVFALWHLCNSLFINKKIEMSKLCVFALHFSFVIILLGAFVTHKWGKQGAVELEKGKATTSYINKYNDYRTLEFPFAVKLTDFRIVYYQGTNTPQDYVSTIEVDGAEGVVSMNNIFEHKGYRFYQSSYSSNQNVVLLVNYDKYGIAITYFGYLLLFLSMISLFFMKNTQFRHLLSRLSLLMKEVESKQVALGLILLCVTPMLYAHPQSLPKKQADNFCNLCVYYNGRLQPLSCLADDYTEKIYGKSKYKDLTAEQVYVGWLLMPYSWLDEPMFKLKSADRKALHLKGKYATYNQLFAAKQNNVVLSKYAEEKIAIVQMLLKGELTRIYPYVSDSENKPLSIEWYSQGSNLPVGMPDDEWFFIKKSMDYVGELAVTQDYARLDTVISKLKKNQVKVAGSNLPSNTRFSLEQTFKRVHYSKPLAMFSVTVGLILFIIYIILFSRGVRANKYLFLSAYFILVAEEIFLTIMLSARWYISGHIPLSNGHETMQALAWIAMLIGIIVVNAFKNVSLLERFFVLSATSLISGFALLVSMMTASNPQITSLMPVLQSPLLSIHVTIIMLAYALLFFIMINSLGAIIRYGITKSADAIERQMLVSQILLYPAICCLTIGIFVGAIWANISWGSYWQWDPKEVWALITMLVYAIAIHTKSIKILRKPLVFHLYCVIAFLFVLFTYFGVNFFLGGMHSYA